MPVFADEITLLSYLCALHYSTLASKFRWVVKECMIYTVINLLWFLPAPQVHFGFSPQHLYNVVLKEECAGVNLIHVVSCGEKSQCIKVVISNEQTKRFVNRLDTKILTCENKEKCMIKCQSLILTCWWKDSW